MRRGRPYEIAIIGMGCRFAGASDLSTYFENILSARDCTREVPRDRWNAATFCDPDSQANDRVPRAGAATWIRRSGSTPPRTGSCRAPSKGASPNNSWCWTRPSPRSRMPGCRSISLKQSRRGRDRPRQLLQSRQPDAAPARPHDRPDAVDSRRTSSRVVRGRPGSDPGRSSGQFATVRGGDDPRPVDQCDGRAHRPSGSI